MEGSPLCLERVDASLSGGADRHNLPSNGQVHWQSLVKVELVPEPCKKLREKHELGLYQPPPLVNFACSYLKKEDSITYLPTLFYGGYTPT